MQDVLKTLYWNHYTPEKNKTLEQKLNLCHEQLIESIGKTERKLVLQMIDGKDEQADEIGLDSFIFGFKLALEMIHELKTYDGQLLGTHAEEEVRRSDLSD